MKSSSLKPQSLAEIITALVTMASHYRNQYLKTLSSFQCMRFGSQLSSACNSAHQDNIPLVHNDQRALTVRGKLSHGEVDIIIVIITQIDSLWIIILMIIICYTAISGQNNGLMLLPFPFWLFLFIILSYKFCWNVYITLFNGTFLLLQHVLQLGHVVTKGQPVFKLYNCF